MLDIKKLDEIREYLNLKKICTEADVKYVTVSKKVYRFRNDRFKGELTNYEAKRMWKTLQHLVKMIENNSTKD